MPVEERQPAEVSQAQLEPPETPKRIRAPSDRAMQRTPATPLTQPEPSSFTLRRINDSPSKRAAKVIYMPHAYEAIESGAALPSGGSRSRLPVPRRKQLKGVTFGGVDEIVEPLAQLQLVSSAAGSSDSDTEPSAIPARPQSRTTQAKSQSTTRSKTALALGIEGILKAGSGAQDIWTFFKKSEDGKETRTCILCQYVLFDPFFFYIY